MGPIGALSLHHPDRRSSLERPYPLGWNIPLATQFLCHTSYSHTHYEPQAPTLQTPKPFPRHLLWCHQQQWTPLPKSLPLDPPFGFQKDLEWGKLPPEFFFLHRKLLPQTPQQD